MKILYLVRHAKATKDPAYHWDFERPLDSRGEAEAPLMAKKLADEVSPNGLKPAIIVSSPSARTMATARFFASAFGILERDIVQNKNLYEASLSVLLEVVNDLPDQFKAAMIIGHNPSISLAASLFSKSRFDHVPTCGIIKIEGAVDSWGDFKPGKALATEMRSPKSE